MAFDPIITEAAIKARIRELGRHITAGLKADASLVSPTDVSLVVIGVLKGAFVFMADLVRELPPTVTCDFLRTSSYHGGTESSGTVRFDFDLTQPIAGKHVLIVEDIVDTGLTMDFLLKALAARGPLSIKVAALLDKPSRRKRDVRVDYVGFTIEDRFVIGYGLDLDGRYRNLPYVAARVADPQCVVRHDP